MHPLDQIAEAAAVFLCSSIFSYYMQGYAIRKGQMENNGKNSVVLQSDAFCSKTSSSHIQYTYILYIPTHKWREMFLHQFMVYFCTLVVFSLACTNSYSVWFVSLVSRSRKLMG